MVVRYGVFRLGQLWTVISDNGTRLAFLTHEQAVEAARGLISKSEAWGEAAEMYLQDHTGRFTCLGPMAFPDETNDQGLNEP